MRGVFIRSALADMDVDVEVDLLHAGLRRLMRRSGMPAAVTRRGVADVCDFQAAPLAARREHRACPAAELPGEEHLVAAGPAKDMRTQFTMVAAIATRDLAFVLDRLANEPVGCAGHGVAPGRQHPGRRMVRVKAASRAPRPRASVRLALPRRRYSARRRRRRRAGGWRGRSEERTS